jgi:hypothetical protein
MFFVSVIPSEIRRFKFMVSWLCDDHVAADSLVVKRPRHRAMTAPLRAFEGALFSKIDLWLIVSRELIEDSRMEMVIGLQEAGKPVLRFLLLILSV